MILERFLMKIFTPTRLAKRDATRVYQAISMAAGRVQRGSLIGCFEEIPERDLADLLEILERQGYIERDPGPFDAPYVRNRLLSWWCPGRHWDELRERVESWQ